jgi:hypothetical protein
VSSPSSDAPAAKAARTEAIRDVPRRRVIRFVSELLCCAARSGNFGARVADERCEAWKRDCVQELTERYAQGNLVPLIVFLEKSFAKFASKAVGTVETICEIATAKTATKDDFAYVLGDRSAGHDATWTSTAERMVQVCVMWRLSDHVAGNRVGLRATEFVRQHNIVLVDLETQLMLVISGMPEKGLQKADDYTVVQCHEGRTYHDLCFAATTSSAIWLVRRTPAPQVKHDTKPEDNDKDTAVTRNIVAQEVLHPKWPVVVPARLCDATNDAIDVVAVSGETGTGKTLSTIAAARRLRATTFYAISHELNLATLEVQLKNEPDRRTHAMHATKHLIDMMSSAPFDWNPKLATISPVCLVIDEVGPYPRCARAICKIGNGNRGLSALQAHFMTTGAMKLFVVGTGVDHAFAHVGSMPPSQVHVRTHEFTDLQKFYEDKSDLWKTIRQHAAAEDLKSGVYAKLLRLSHNMRFAAIFIALSTVDIDLMMRTAKCRGARESFLRNYAAFVLWGALRSIKDYNGLSQLDEIRATTQFGAAFAVACSNKEQRSNSVVKRFIAYYGLLRESYTNGNEPLTHRFAMSPSAVEIGLSGFGMAPPTDGWSGFEAMMADLLYLHAYGAACAGLLDVELTSVASEEATDSNVDPLARIKDWLREHGRGARRVLRTTLNKQVTTCSSAVGALESQAAGQLGAGDAMAPCIVIARNGDKAPFADVVIGLVAVVAGTFKTTHMMLLQLKFFRTASLTAYQAWLEMFKMGCRKRSSLIAGCVAKLKSEPWPDALSRLTVDASLMAAHPGPFKDGNAAQETLFSALCSDTAVDVVGSPYLEALDRWRNNVDRSVGPTVAHVLSALKSETPSLDVIRGEIGEFPGCAEVIHASFRKKLTVCDRYNKIMTAAGNWPSVNDDVSTRTTQEMSTLSEIQRFIVVYLPSTHARNDGPTQQRHVAKKKVHPDAPSEKTKLLIAKPTDCLTIDSGSSAAAFYPTGWENEVYTERASVHETCMKVKKKN